ncbi:DUF1028 domain-containing protein [Notoacmeibacter sp. MSK16QG-6]|uniref:DUF1028 domain-containing protein n=1 Tax=Notoacmeibacter sp. MSK16QG-6 TaxID=2957982 RepID=UPI00209C9D13|nr:DUF1028 domain-containing protein [Notoacmeibacter sp. MSK16QG-6]MCP1199254.1 DUF1028 domain-containing protein [Notoacmeibacter sp. MSK16QG-6]
MTYSIIGRDRDRGEIGCAVQSKFPGVSSVVLHGRGGVGAVTTQGFADPSAAAKILDLIGRGAKADEAVTIAVRDLDGVSERQFGVMAMHGEGVGHTGAAMDNWNGFAACIPGKECLVGGNALAGENVLTAMIMAYEATCELRLPDRLIAALRAGRDAGGELRGQQAAGLLVVKEEGGYGGLSDRMVDINIYDHEEPIEELARCFKLHRLSYFSSEPDKMVTIEGEIAEFLKALMKRQGYETSDGDGWVEADTDGLARFMGEANYDNRIHYDGRIDSEVLDDLRVRYG